MRLIDLDALKWRKDKWGTSGEKWYYESKLYEMLYALPVVEAVPVAVNGERLELIDRKRLREILQHEQAKYILSDYMQGKHIGAGFALALVELDSQPEIKVDKWKQ